MSGDKRQLDWLICIGVWCIATGAFGIFSMAGLWLFGVELRTAG